MPSYTIEKSLTKPKTKATVDSWPKLTEPSEAEVFVSKSPPAEYHTYSS